MEKYKNIKGELLDIGSGSGILGLLAVKSKKNLLLNQCELQKTFIKLSCINSKNNKITASMYEGKYQDISFDKKFDICISNPPFYHSSVIKSDNISLKIARYNDSLSLEDLIKKTSRILNNKGKFFFCYDIKQINDIIIQLNKYKFNIESLQFVHPRKEKDATLILVYARLDSKSLCKIMSPLIVFDKEEFTQDVQNIYKMSSTHSIKVDI